MKRTIKFSWKALILAPLPIPLIYSLALVILIPGRSSFLFFLILCVLGSAFSYGATVFLFLPSLFLLSIRTPLTAPLTCLLGTVIGGLTYLPVAWLMFMTSGDNSGPPEGLFGDFLWQNLLEPITWLFPVGGLITALIYWFLINQPSEKND